MNFVQICSQNQHFMGKITRKSFLFQSLGIFVISVISL